MNINHRPISPGLRQSTLTIFGNMAGTALSAIALILISRLLGPEKFGEFSVGFSIVLILVKVNDLGLGTSILKYAAASDDKQEKAVIYSLVTRYKLILSGLIMLTGILSASFLSELMNFENNTIILISFSVGLSTVYYEHLLSILQSSHRFGQAIIANALQAGSKLIGATVLFLLHFNQASLIYFWYVLAPLSPVILAKYLLPKDFKLPLNLHSKNLQRKILKLSIHASIGLVSAGIIENVDILFLQKYFNSYDTGLYSGVNRIALMFALVAYSLANVLNPRVAKYKSRVHLQPYLKKATLLLLLSLAGFTVFIPFAPLFIKLTIGSAYLAGTETLLILTAASFLAIASIPFIALFYAYDADWYFSVSGILQLAIVLIGNIIFVPKFGLEAAAWTRLATRFMLFTFTVISGLIIYRKHYAHDSTQITPADA